MEKDNRMFISIDMFTVRHGANDVVGNAKNEINTAVEMGLYFITGGSVLHERARDARIFHRESIVIPPGRG